MTQAFSLLKSKKIILSFSLATGLGFFLLSIGISPPLVAEKTDQSMVKEPIRSLKPLPPSPRERGDYLMKEPIRSPKPPTPPLARDMPIQIQQNIGQWLHRDLRLHRQDYLNTTRKQIYRLFHAEKSLNHFLWQGQKEAGMNEFILGIFQDDARIFGSESGLNEDELRPLASVSKVFTAVAVVQLAQKGLLKLNDPIQKYFPGLPQAQKPLGGVTITVADFLRHSSGVPYKSRRAGGGTIISPIRKIHYFIPAQTRPAASHYNYSNQNYYLLGALIEKVSGQSYPHYIENHIFKPLGLQHSKVSQRANAASGIHSTINELKIFYQHLMKPKKHQEILINQESLTKMLAVPKYVDIEKEQWYYGLGVQVRLKDNELREIYHNGRWKHTAARLSYFVQEDSYMAYLAAPANFRSKTYMAYHYKIAWLAGQYVSHLQRILDIENRHLAEIVNR